MARTKFVARTTIHNFNVRNTYLFTIPEHSISLFYGSFSYIAVKIINLLHIKALLDSKIVNIKRMVLGDT